MDDFYASLGSLSGPSRVASWLTDADVGRLKAAQVRHLDHALSPGVDAVTLSARSREIGLVHGRVHSEALRGRGGVAHREAWEQLVALVGED